VDERRIWGAIERAGVGIWLPAHFEGAPPAEVGLVDLIAVGEAWIAIGRAADEVWVAPIVADGGFVRRAVPGDGVATLVLGVLATGAVGSLTAERYAAAISLGGSERGMTVDQSNESVIVGDRAVVKLFPRTRPGPQPGLDLPAHLSAVGFGEIPAPLGAIVWRGDTLIASVASFVPGARDGWAWYVDDVLDACERDDWVAADAHAAVVGGLVARLHRALATPSSVFETPVGTADADRIASWRADADARLAEALALTAGAEGERLRALAPTAATVIASLASIERTPTMRIHGDLHVGQVLRGGDGALYVNDFDGNPLVLDRTVPDAPARDVAAMTCAIDHVGRVVARRQPAHVDAAAAWADRSREAFLGAYRAALGDRRELFDERLLAPFEVAQEAHEFVYATHYLPRWRYVPDAVMPAVLERWSRE
jgi:maltokinase